MRDVEEIESLPTQIILFSLAIATIVILLLLEFSLARFLKGLRTLLRAVDLMLRHINFSANMAPQNHRRVRYHS